MKIYHCSTFKHCINCDKVICNTCLDRMENNCPFGRTNFLYKLPERDILIQVLMLMEIWISLFSLDFFGGLKNF